MRKWALMNGPVCVNVAVFTDAPTLPGDWREVTGLNISPGRLWNGVKWIPTPATVTLDKVYAFKLQFTPQEIIAGKVLANTDAEVAEFIDNALDVSKNNGVVQVSLLQQGLALLVAKGVLTPERSAAIWAAINSEVERP